MDYYIAIKGNYNDYQQFILDEAFLLDQNLKVNTKLYSIHDTGNNSEITFDISNIKSTIKNIFDISATYIKNLNLEEYNANEFDYLFQLGI